MRERSRHIFSNIVTNENAFTELLCNLFQFKEFRQIFADLIGAKLRMPGFAFDYADVGTQDSDPNSGRTDMRIENEDVLLFIENKIDSLSPLTRNQPVSYLRRLRRMRVNKKKALLFLIPDDFARERQIQLQADAFQRDKGLERVHFMILYWQELAEKLHRSKLPQSNTVLEQFDRLMQDWFYIPDLRFDAEEVNMLFDKRIPAELLRVTAIVEEVMKKVGKSYKIRREINEFGNGFYVKNSDGESTVWFGVWYEIWAKRAFPLACCVSNDVGVTVINRFRRRFGKDAFLVDEDEGWTCYGIPPDKLTDKNNVRELARFLNHTVALLQK